MIRQMYLLIQKRLNKWIKRESYKQYCNNFESLDEMDEFFPKYESPILTKKEM